MNIESLNLLKDKNFKDIFSISIGKVYSNQVELCGYIKNIEDYSINKPEGKVIINNKEYNIQFLGTYDKNKNMWITCEFDNDIKDEHVSEAIKIRKLLTSNDMENIYLKKEELPSGITSDKLAVIYTFFSNHYCYLKDEKDNLINYVLIENLPNNIFNNINDEKFITRMLEIIDNYDINEKLMIHSFLLNNNCNVEIFDDAIITTFDNKKIKFIFDEKDKYVNHLYED